MIMGKKELDRIEELQHREVLLGNCIDYLIELWGINEKDKIVAKFKDILGFTDEDIEFFYIKGDE